MKTYKDKIRKNIKVFYVNSILSGMVGILAPVIVIFQLKTLGLSLAEVLLGEAIFAAAVLLAEIPSGIFADRHGRKSCLLVAEFLVICSFSVLTVSQNFWHIAIGQIFVGVGIAFASGAKDALIFDTLKELGSEANFKQILAKLNTLLFSFAIFSNILAGILGSTMGLRVPLFLATVFTAMSFVNLFRLTEPKNAKDGQEKNIYLHFWKSLKFIWKKKIVRYIIIFSMIMGVGMKLSFHTLPAYWNEMDVPIILFGIGLATHNALAACVSHFSQKITKKYNDVFLLGGLLLIVCTTFAIMSQIHFGLILAILFPSLFQIIRALLPVVVDDLIHQITFSHKRATVMSMKSFLVQGSVMIGLPIFGYFADLWSLLTAFGGLAIIVLILGGVSLWKFKTNL